jgi:hypothetical protein
MAESGSVWRMNGRPGARISAAMAALLAGLLLLASGAPAQTTPPEAQLDAQLQQEPIEPTGLNPAVAAFDVIVVRPLAATALPIGCALFLPAALITAPNGLDSVKEAAEFFVIGPARYVFTRPLGEF